MNVVNRTRQTGSGTSAASDATGATSAVQLKAQLRNLQTLDSQAAALAPRESSTNTQASDAPTGAATNDLSAGTTDDFAALLAKVAADPAKLCDQAFIDALTAKKGVLNADESDKLVAIFRSVTATQRAKLVEAIGAAPMEKAREEQRKLENPVTVQEYERSHPGERVVTPAAKGGTLPGTIKVVIGFKDLEHEAIFAELLKLPPGARKNREVLRRFVPSPEAKAGKEAIEASFYTYNSTETNAAGVKTPAESRQISIANANVYVKDGNAQNDDQSKKAIIGRATRHEVGHAFDYKKHAGEVTGTGWHKEQGWTAYAANLAGLSQALQPVGGPWAGAPKTTNLEANRAIGEKVIAAVISAGGAPKIQEKTDETMKAEAQSPADFSAWFPKTQAYRFFTTAPDIKGQWKERFKVDGGLLHYFSTAPQAFYHANGGLTAKLLAWDNYRAAFTPREWAAECYAAWFDVAKPGDPPGQKDPGAKHLTDGALAWVKDPDLHKDDAPAPATK